MKLLNPEVETPIRIELSKNELKAILLVLTDTSGEGLHKIRQMVAEKVHNIYALSHELEIAFKHVFKEKVDG